MYKIVVYWRWDRGTKTADCFWCVPWPEITTEEFGQLADVARNTHILTHGSPAGFRADDPDVLTAAGYPEAGKMLRQIPNADLRARFNQMEMEVYNSDVPLTREQLEEIVLGRTAA